MGDSRSGALERRIAKAEKTVTSNPSDQRAAVVLAGLLAERQTR